MNEVNALGVQGATQGTKQQPALPNEGASGASGAADAAKAGAEKKGELPKELLQQWSDEVEGAPDLVGGGGDSSAASGGGSALSTEPLQAPAADEWEVSIDDI